MHDRDVQHVRQTRLDSSIRREGTRKKSWSLTFLSEADNSFLKRVHKVLTRDFVHFEYSFSAKIRLMRVTDHLEGLGKLHTEDPINSFCSKKRINPIIEERCSDVLSSLSSATSITVLTPGTSMLDCTEHQGNDVTRNRIQRSLITFGPSTLEKSDLKLNTDQLMIQHDCWSIHFSNVCAFVSLYNRKTQVSPYKLIELTSFSTSLRRFENLAFRKSWKHSPVDGMEGPDVIKIPKVGKSWTRISIL